MTFRSNQHNHGTIFFPFILISVVISYSYKSFPRVFSLHKFNIKANSGKISQIEDDGYSLAQGKRSLWNKWKSYIQPVQPGNLILIRHGESVLNFNRTFTGSPASFMSLLYLFVLFYTILCCFYRVLSITRCKMSHINSKRICYMTYSFYSRRTIMLTIVHYFKYLRMD